MESFVILVLGDFNSGKTSFVRSLDEHAGSPLPLKVAYEYYGPIVVSDAELHFAVWPAQSNTIVRALAPSLFEDLVDIENIFKRFSRVDLSGIGVIFIVDSTDPERDWRNESRLQEIRDLYHRNPFVYAVALSRQDSPNARTPQQIREDLSIPDDIKILGYDLNRPASTKQVVLELMELFPRNEITQQVIDALKSQITD